MKKYQLHFTIAASLGGAIALLLVGILLQKLAQAFRERQLEPLIKEIAAKYDIDYNLVKALIWQESRFRPKAVGKAGELGLMQISHMAFDDWRYYNGKPSVKFEDILEPKLNLEIGCWFLARAIGRYNQTDNPIPYALAEYNAGRSNVLRWAIGVGSTNSNIFISQIDYPKTRWYVKQILKKMELYQSHRK